MRLSKRHRQVIVFLFAAIFLLSAWLSWRILRIPDVSMTQLFPERPIASIHVARLDTMIKEAKADDFLKAAVETPLIQEFTRSWTWRQWVRQKQNLEFQLQTQIDERYIKEVFGERATMALYPGSSFLIGSVVSVIARYQILWNEWTDVFHAHYRIETSKYRGIRLATLTTQGGTFYYALIGRLGFLSSDVQLLRQAMDRYRDSPQKMRVHGITTYIDFTRGQAGTRASRRYRGGMLDSLLFRNTWAPLLREWRSHTRFEKDRWISEHRLTFHQPLEMLPNTTSVMPGQTIPDDAALAGFLRIPPRWLWDAVRPYVHIRGQRPDLGPYLLSELGFVARATDQMLPATALSFPLNGSVGISDTLQKLHGNVSLMNKPIKVSSSLIYSDTPIFRLSWSPALLLRFRGGYAVTDDYAILSNDMGLMKRTIDTIHGTSQPLNRLTDLRAEDGALWIDPGRFIPLLKQLIRLTSLTATLTGKPLPWLTQLTGSTDPLELLHEIRASMKLERETLTIRIEVAP